MSVEEAYSFIDEVAGELLGVSSRLLYARIEEKLGRKPRSWGEALDTLEALMASWSALEESWSRSARDFLLARIYREAHGSWKKMFPRRKIERRVEWRGLRLLYSRYLVKKPSGFAAETPDELVWRVASYVATAEQSYGSSGEAEKAFYDLISTLRFLPNSPTLMNAGTKYPQLAACFVIPLEDDMDAILEAVKVSTWVFKTGAGAGYDFSPLRPRGSPIRGTGGVSSGPVSFMRIFDVVADVVKEGGKRRAAMMGVLHDWHQDVFEFIESKCSSSPLFENFNISIGVHNAFMEAVVSGKEWRLYDPSKCFGLVGSLSEDLSKLEDYCPPTMRVSAREVLEKASRCAWLSGDPGVVFVDTINLHNPTPRLGRIHATNPCGETPLLDWEACNLGSINLAGYVDEREKRIDWEALARDVETAVRFLDDVIEVSWYPDKRIEEAVKKTRKIGLGVMGWADALALLGVAYDSYDALFLADRVMEFIAYHARRASNRLAEERGSYPAFTTSIHREGRLNFEPQTPAGEIYREEKVSETTREIVADRPPLDWMELKRELKRGTRNATVTTIAPTGSISIIAGASSSIEPFFALVYIRRSTIGSWVEVNPHLYKWLKENNMLEKRVLEEIASHGGGVRWASWAPRELKQALPTALEISWEWHVRMQAVFQRWVDNAVSKTINMPSTASPREVYSAFILAWRLGCKGVTVYRDKSREAQVLEASREISEVIENPPETPKHKDRQVYNWIRVRRREVMIVQEDYAGGCPTCDL